MKLTFEPNDILIVQTTVNRLLANASRTLEPEMIRTLSRMRHKFTPNALTITLKRKEQAVVALILEGVLK